MVDGYCQNPLKIFIIYRSSGTTNHLVIKVFLKSTEDQKDILEMQSKLIETFKLKERRTLVVIGLSLGSWAGGEQISFLFKTLAFVQDIHLVVFSPGDQHSEII
jgi:phenylacetate-coenzyme A ligase PaaK-like adenylate-forming protein